MSWINDFIVKVAKGRYRYGPVLSGGKKMYEVYWRRRFHHTIDYFETEQEAKDLVNKLRSEIE